MASESDRAAQQQRIAERDQRQQAAMAEAERYAHERGLINDPPPGPRQPTPAELLTLLGGAERASEVLTDPAKLAGLPRVVTMAELDAQRAADAAFLAHGGGRMPQPPAPEPPAQPARPRLSAEWINDPDCIYDDASLALIRQARGE